MGNDSPSVDELLRQGTVCLTDDRPEQACERAREALRRRPNHPLASNLLGLGKLGLGRNTDARELFEELLRRNPDVVPLRVNAGLAALGDGELEGALDHLRRAVDLDHSHKRAFGYLALVHLRLGEPGFARAALQEAGLSALAQQIGQDDPEAVLQELELGVRTLPAGEATPAPHEGFAEAGAVPKEALETDETDAVEAAEAVEEIADALDIVLLDKRKRHSAPTQEMPPEVTRKVLIPRGSMPTVQPEAGTLTLPEKADADLQDRLLVIGLNTSTTEDGVVARRDQLVVQHGELIWRDAERRRKGKSDGKFDLPEGASLQLAEGDGSFVLDPGPGFRYHLFRLQQSGLYVREQDIAAFTDRLYWENGRLPQAGEDGPSLVTVRGTGFVAIRTRGRLWKLRTSNEQVITADIEHVLGWSPNAVPVNVDTSQDRLQVDFSGAGVVWLDLPEG